MKGYWVNMWSKIFVSIKAQETEPSHKIEAITPNKNQVASVPSPKQGNLTLEIGNTEILPKK